MDTALLLLADGRFPSGGHAHSAGLEAAVAAGRVTDVVTLESFLRGRLATAGPVTASFAAGACLAASTPANAPSRAPAPSSAAAHPAAAAPEPAFGQLDAELDARIASPALRLVSRRQGRAWVRAGRATWPSGCFDRLPVHPEGPHQPIALGVVCAAAGLTVEQAALVAAYGVMTGPANAAVRLLGLDPYHVQGLLARLAATCDAIAGTAAAAADKAPAELPAHAAPLADITAEIHATWEVRLFAS